MCLVLAGIFGIYAGKVGVDDVSAVMRYTNNQRSVIAEIADVTEQGIEKLEAEEEQHKQDIMDATENKLVDEIGSEQLEEGEKQYEEGKAEYDSGKAQYDSGKAQYDAAKKQYDEKYAQYEAACEQVEDAKAQLEDAKVQRDEGQAQLDQATPAYNAIKQYVNLADGKVYEYTKYLADPIAQTFGYSSAQAVVTAYEDGQKQLADANVQIADAEAQIADAENQLADAKVQLDDGKKQLDAAKAKLDSAKSQLDVGKAQLDEARAELDAGHETVDASVDELEAALDALKAYDDAEAQVRAGVAQLMSTPAIANKVEDESDYRSVIAATEIFIDENKDAVNAEMTVRQSLYTMLITASIVCFIVGVLGVITALNPSGALLNTATYSAIGAAVLTVGFTLYGLLNGSRDFAFFYLDALENVAGTGSTQNLAFVALAVVAVFAAAISIMCRNAYRRVLIGGVEESAAPEAEISAPEPIKAPAPTPPPVAPTPNAKPKAKKQPAPKINGMTAEEMAAETARLNAEAERMEESNAQLAALKKAQEEYEEARRRFEAARNGGKQ